MARLPSINHQLWQQLESRNAINESRHEAKLRAREQNSRVETIHSYGTYASYKKSSKIFAKWLKLEFPKIKDISDIDKDIGAMYIKHRANIGVSAYTYSQDMAMLNKIMNLGLTKSYCGVNNRSLKAITKSRIDNGFRTSSGAIETIIRASGLRRNELYNLKKENLIIRDGRVTGVKVVKGAKGGRIRTVEVIGNKHQESFYRIVEKLRDNEMVITEEIPKKLQTHRLRAEYAQNMIIELNNLGREDPYKSLSKSMGHNRKSILVYYGVKMKK